MLDNSMFAPKQRPSEKFQTAFVYESMIKYPLVSIPRLLPAAAMIAYLGPFTVITLSLLVSSTPAGNTITLLPIRDMFIFSC